MGALGPEAVLQVLLYCWTEVVLCETLDLLDRFAVCGGVSVTLCPSCMKLCRIYPTESHLHSPLLFHLFVVVSCLISSFLLFFLFLFVSSLIFLFCLFSSLLCLICLVSSPLFRYTFSLLFVIVSHLNSLSHLFLVSLHLLSPFCHCVLSQLILSPVLSSPLCHVSSLPYLVLPPLSSHLHFSSHHLSCFVTSLSSPLIFSLPLSYLVSVLLLILSLFIICFVSPLVFTSSPHLDSSCLIFNLFSPGLIFSSLLFSSLHLSCRLT